jgi:hypothetical protein
VVGSFCNTELTSTELTRQATYPGVNQTGYLSEHDIKTVYGAENAARLDMKTLARLADALRVPYQRVVKANEEG